MENTSKPQMEISIADLIMIVRKRLLLVILATLFATVVAFIYSNFFITPKYTSTAIYSVIEATKDGSTTSSRPSDQQDFIYLNRATSNYVHLFKTRDFLTLVAEDSNLGYTTEQLKNMISTSIIETTMHFNLSVTCSDPEDALAIQNSILKLRDEMVAEKTLNTINIIPLETAILPQTQSYPNIKLNTIIGAFLGFVLGFLLSLLLEIMDTNIKSRTDLISRFPLPVLVSIPSFDINSSNKNKKNKKQKTRKNQKSISTRTVEILNKKTNFAIKEAFKTLRTNLQFTLTGKECEVITISSAVPMDGKSTITVNLAITIAQTGARVLIIDCDLRKGRLHKFFEGAQNKVGASNVISGMVTAEKAIQKAVIPDPESKVDSLYILCSGSIPPNPSELVASNNMAKMLEVLRKDFDYILIDTPPVNIVSDALPITKISEGVLLVVRQNQTSYADVENAIKNFELVGSNLLGFILNGVDIESGKNYKYKYGKYKSYSYNAYSYYSNDDENSDEKNSDDKTSKDTKSKK